VIEISKGCDVDRFLDRVTGHPHRYIEVVVCSPFIDGRMLDRIAPLARTARQARCDFRVITLPDAAQEIRTRLQCDHPGRHDILVSTPRLHAKIYLAIARRINDSEAIVTSANLTSAGVTGNIELGVRARPNSESGRRLLSQVDHFVRQLAG
jgi:hypothetical protein